VSILRATEKLLNLIKETDDNNLTELDLTGYALKQLPPEITKLSQLTSLNLSFNNLTQLPLEFVKLQNLTKLDLSFNDLSEVPLEITKLKRLVTLKLGGNRLKRLPAEITDLKELTNLSLSNNLLDNPSGYFIKMLDEISDVRIRLRPSLDTAGINALVFMISRNKLTEFPLEITTLKGLTDLNLCGNEIKELPADIIKLRCLKKLDLSFNKLTTLPVEIRELQSLLQFDLSENDFTVFPSEITQLRNLTQLELSGNKLSKLPIQIEKLRTLTELDLSNNQFKFFPSEVTSLLILKHLNLSRNGLTQLSSEIRRLTDLIYLGLDNNELTSLPTEITKLNKLKSINLSRNKLVRIPNEITKMTNLTQLNLSQNNFTDSAVEITSLQSLTHLYLSGNNFSSFPKQILELKNLIKLSLSENQLTEVPKEISKLRNLTQLELSKNKVSKIPVEITKLYNLTTLDLSLNKFTRIPIEITSLLNLQQLYLSGNQLTEIPTEIKNLLNLTQLNLSENQLIEIPNELTELTNLIQLNLSSNKLTSIPAEIRNLQKLEDFNLTRNQLTRIPREITELQNLKGLILSDNPLKSPPPEIASGEVDDIFTYLSQTDFEEQNEAKLILVGNGDVGKTCLAKRLIHDKFIRDKMTEGINILEWRITSPNSLNNEIKLNIWDFGGQEIYHATHQFFLTKRSVYILVWNARKTEDYDNIFYWLHTVESFGGDSPLLLVMTKLNEYNDDLNLESLRRKFKMIREYVKVDSEDGKGFSDLKNKLSEIAWNLPQMQVPWPRSWINVRQKLESLNKNWITDEEFRNICKSEGLDEKNIEVLDYYLHNLGVILHFKDRLELENMVILNPEWATTAVYQILSTESVSKQGGILFHCELDRIWDSKEYPRNIHSKLLELMNKFELAYELPDKKSHFVSELLPKNITENKPELSKCENKKENMCFYYSYDFLPAGIMTRFIVRVHENLVKKSDGTPLCWKEGALLVLENTHALVTVKTFEKQIEVKIAGEQKRRLLEIIRYHFDEINKSFEKITVGKKIPCNCSDKCDNYFDYDSLLEAEKKGKNTVECQKNWLNVPLASLLEGYKTKRDELGKDIFEYEKGQIRIDVSPVINLEQHQVIENNNTTITNINIDLKVDLPKLQKDFSDIKEEIENLKDIDAKITNELDKIQDILDEMGPESSKDKFNKPMNKLSRFIQKLNNPNSEYNKIISESQKSIESAQKLGRTYNKFAQWLAMPQIPDLFLAK
jgi:small GTP-binding protein